MLKAAVSPARNEKTGRTVRLEPLDMARHSDDLWREQQPQLWDYLPDGPFTTREAFDAAFVAKQHSTEQLFWAVVDVASGSAWGCASIMSISLPNAVCEVGYVWFTKRLQQTRQATEAFFLFLRIAFEEMACRRCVWKCNAQNEPSKRAAARLGFTAEGVHRKQLIVKGRNRDTAWFSMLDDEWPQHKARLETWLRDDNFDTHNKQRSKL